MSHFFYCYALLSAFMLSVVFYLLWCLMSLRWMLICWMSICWLFCFIYSDWSYASCRYADCRILFIVMLNAIMLSGMMLNVVMLRVAFYLLLCLMWICWVSQSEWYLPILTTIILGWKDLPGTNFLTYYARTFINYGHKKVLPSVFQISVIYALTSLGKRLNGLKGSK
jgi:hypothetical protein